MITKKEVTKITVKKTRLPAINECKLWDDLEFFDSKINKYNIPFVAINKSKVITFSSKFYVENEEKFANKKFALMSYSAKNNAILFFFSDKDNGGFRLTKQNRKTNALNLRSTRFFERYNCITTDSIAKFKPHYFEDIAGKGECWGIYLAQQINSKDK
jgi:hypothetical protein